MHGRFELAGRRSSSVQEGQKTRISVIQKLTVPGEGNKNND